MTMPSTPEQPSPHAARPGLASATPAPSWQRAMHWCSLAGAAMCATGVLGAALAVVASLRSILMQPSLVLLAVGATVLLATLTVALVLRRSARGERSAAAALRERPLLAAALVAGSALLAVGVIAPVHSGLLFVITANPRSTFTAIAGTPLVVFGAVVLAAAVRAMRASPTTSQQR